MTPAPPAPPPGPELDQRVAVDVMGWRPGDARPDRWQDEAGNLHGFVDSWRPSTDPTADYEVLKHVRDNWPWNGAGQLSFVVALARLNDARIDAMNNRIGAFHYGRSYDALFYEPGDYSRAALAALAAAAGE